MESDQQDTDGKRNRPMTEKGLGYALENKRKELRDAQHKLSHFIQSAGTPPRDDENCIENAYTSFAKALDEFKELLSRLEEPCDSDMGLIKIAEEWIAYSYNIINQIKHRDPDKSSATTRTSRKSKSVCTGSSVSSSSSAKLRAKAAAEAAAAAKNAEYDRLIAEKEHEQKQREAEEEIRRIRERALHEKNIAMLAADKKLAIANAKLDAIDAAIREEDGELNEHEMSELDLQTEMRTAEWVERMQRNGRAVAGQDESKPRDRPPPIPINTPVIGGLTTDHAKPTRRPHANYLLPPPLSRPFIASTPIRDITGSQIVEALTTTNQQIVSSIAKQNLPKCHPDTFNGDATLFHPWKKAFKAMLSETEVTPEQEINYLRKFTSGEVQRVVDNYRKRQYNNPNELLKSLWSELERRFGSAAVITNALLERLRLSANFDENNAQKLQEFSDICGDVDSQIDTLPGLACLNFPMAITPIVQRMPASLKSKWEKEVAQYAEKNNDAYPGFHRLAQIVRKQAIIKNHPNITAGETLNTRRRTEPSRKTLATRLERSQTLPTSQPTPSNDDSKHCPFHDRRGHTLSECKAFESKTLQEKTAWIKKASLCFLCFSKSHVAKNCDGNISCDICSDKRHNTLLHKDKQTVNSTDDPSDINAKCTTICDHNGGLSCSKIVLVDVYRTSDPKDKRRVYAVIDDQSNASLVSSELLDEMGVDSPREKYYLSTCSSSSEVKYGRKVSDLTVCSIVEGKEFSLPQLTECDAIPCDKREIPSPQMVKRFPHLESIADEIPALDANANIQLLLGRDAPELLKVRAFKNGPRGAPWAQRLNLGWTVSGQTCLDLADRNIHIKARKTNLVQRTQETSPKGSSLHGEECDVTPCPNHFTLTTELPRNVEKALSRDVFHTQSDDNEASLSVEDRKFIRIMQDGLTKNEHGNWEMPLPFRQDGTTMPNNRTQAVQRLNSLTRTLSKKPEMKRHYFEFMEKIISKGHASQIPAEDVKVPDGQVWYLPHFGVYHPKKPNQIRVVFDSSAEYEGVSLNKELLSGPDLANNLTGVLIRFRRNEVAVMCDIEQMFHSFHVSTDHRNYLRFLWYEDNDPEKGICEYRMNVHLFGNGPSPAVATYGLRATTACDDVDSNVKEFVCRNFYVDDGLLSVSTTEEAIKLVKQSQEVLAKANLRLHKVVSNSREVMQAFPVGDIAKDLHDLDLSTDGLPAQRSLGVYWELEKDSFTFRLSGDEKPFTRRGVLSTINSVYDPLGIAAPVVINGKRLLQQLMIAERTSVGHLGWDDPLPEKQMSQWRSWKDDLHALEDVAVPRCYQPKEFGETKRAELHVFSDASQDAIAAAVYLRVFNEHNDVSVALVYGQAKVAPMHPTSIPRLELCGAVMATQAAAKVQKELDMNISEVTYYTDSQVVLGYIMNESKRFYVYVANRVQLIRSMSLPSQWRYIESEINPADLSTRGIPASKLQQSSWITGPDFLKHRRQLPTLGNIEVSTSDPEVRREVKTTKTTLMAEDSILGTERFKRFSSFVSLQRGIALLLAWIRRFKARRVESPSATMSDEKLRPTLQELDAATIIIVRETQRGAGLEASDYMQATNKAHRTDIDNLDPFTDNHGVVRVGGRLRKSSMDTAEKHPVILPKNHHLSTLVVRHFHKKVHHQGRQITHAAIRQGGYWIIGGHRLVSTVLHHCVICRKSRGAHLHQRMADLPADRMEEVPPFTNVGLDVFGPWSVVTRRTRGGAANSKRWGLLFTCLNSRAVHIEVLESMDASAFICALRRFFALRGPATLLRCDRGTNFIGGKSELQQNDEETIKEFVKQQGCEWKFNPPHASHFGGVWERQIGTVRRVVDAMLAELGHQQLTHELFTTLMSEVMAIVNARPIAAIPTDVEDPQPLSPQTILTMKTRPLGPPSGEFLPPDLYARRRWRRVQYLANQFWVRWRREYLQSLQVRNKWKHPTRNLAEGDVVLLKDESHRNNWPMGVVSEAVQSEDGLVRKANITVIRGAKKKTMYRPLKELVLILPVEEQE